MKVGAHMPVEILVWRSVSVRFLRSLIHPWLGGRLWLRHYSGWKNATPLFWRVGQCP